MSTSDPIQESALAAVQRWPWRRHLEVLIEDSHYGSLGPSELQRKLALGRLDLAAGELVASFASDREGRRRAAEVLCGAAIRAILSPHGEASEEALRDLEHARRGLGSQGLLWGGLEGFSLRARDASLSRADRAAARVALWASHLALGESPGEAARMAFVALAEAFEEEHIPEGLSIALAHLERILAGREVEAGALARVARS